MTKAFKRSRALLASASLAAAGLLAPAPAQAIDQRCLSAVRSYCAANWAAAGYYDYGDCVVTLTESVCRYPNYDDPNWPYLPPAARGD